LAGLGPLPGIEPAIPVQRSNQLNLYEDKIRCLTLALVSSEALFTDTHVTLFIRFIFST
jgi:hypothetical protein